MPTYDADELALINLVERTYGTTGVDPSSELGDMQSTDGRWYYREDHERFAQAFADHYGIVIEDGLITRKTKVWELWNELQRQGKV